MDFAQAETQLAVLTNQLRLGQISPESFAQAVNRLQVRDDSGYVWQPHPAGIGWLCWEGMQWRPGIPPHSVPRVPPPQALPTAPRAVARPGIRAQLLSPERFEEITRSVPLQRRPQAWWDVLSLWAGTACGYFWLVYSLVRGMPRLRAFGNAGNSWLDVLPSLVLLCLPVLLFIFRRTALPALSRFFNGLRQMPLARKLGWAALVAIIIAFFQTSNPILVQREGLDLITPLLMFAIPLGLVWFRTEIDRLLLPLQVVLQPIPRLLLTVIGLGAPFLIGFILYNGFNISQYALLRWNVALGMLVSYAILRTPESARPSPSQRQYSTGVAIFLGVAYVLYDVLARAHPALANDFLTDPLNLNDGLRTNGIAPAISGGASGINTLFVNGVEVVRNAKGGKPRPWEPHEERMEQTWSGNGRIVSGRGALDWLKQNNMLDKDGRINKNFRDWLDLLPGDPNTSELEGVYGEFRKGDTDPLSDQITIILRDPNQPPAVDLPDLPELDDEDMIIEPTEDDLIVPNDFVEDPHSHDREGPIWTPIEEPPIEPPAQEPPREVPVEQQTPSPQDMLDALRNAVKEAAGSVPGSVVAGSGSSLADFFKRLDQSDKDNNRTQILLPIWESLKDFYNWYWTKWRPMIKNTYEIHDHDKLPQNLRDRGLYDNTQDSPLSKGLHQTLLNAGESKEYADAVVKKLEADDQQRRRIANLAYDVIDNLKSAKATTDAYSDWREHFGRKMSTAAAGGTAAQEFLAPDPTDFVRELCLKQQGRYNDAVDAWRKTQTYQRWGQTGLSLDNPTTAQDVDKLLRDLQAEQRSIKNELGNDMARIRNDPRMPDLWAEEQALRRLRNETADLNLLNRGLPRK